MHAKPVRILIVLRVCAVQSYQQDPGNGREALVEAALDQAEGADMLLVKPGTSFKNYEV